MSESSQHLRLALTVTQLTLVALGALNLLVIGLILTKPYLRSITNVYMISLCLADFIYLTDLGMVATTSLNGRSWPLGKPLCHIYHGSEAMSKYASVLFVGLLAADRYCAMCKVDYCTKYRNYRMAYFLSACAWGVAFVFSLPLYVYADEKVFILRPKNVTELADIPLRVMCIANWPSIRVSQWYVGLSSVVIFIVPGFVVFYCYYHVFCKLREAEMGSRRLQRGGKGAAYQRVTASVQKVVLFHFLCWSPFWMSTFLFSIFRIPITTQFERIIFNIVHLFPYINCALNPLLYAYRAENFRQAVKSLMCFFMRERPVSNHERRPSTTRSTYYKNSAAAVNCDSPKKTSAAAKCGDVSVYSPEDEIPPEQRADMERLMAERAAWRPYDGNDTVETQVNFDEKNARSIIVPAVTVSFCGDRTAL